MRVRACVCDINFFYFFAQPTRLCRRLVRADISVHKRCVVASLATGAGWVRTVIAMVPGWRLRVTGVTVWYL